jgi:hypothetical protein
LAVLTAGAGAAGAATGAGAGGDDAGTGGAPLQAASTEAQRIVDSADDGMSHLVDARE